MKNQNLQPTQRVMITLKKGDLKKLTLGPAGQKGAKKLRFTAVILYDKIPDKSKIRINAQAGRYEYDINEPININSSHTCVYHFNLKKPAQEIVRELMVGVTAPVILLLLVRPDAYAKRA